MLCAKNGEGLLTHSGKCFVRHFDHRCRHWTLFAPIFVVELVAFLHHGFKVLIDRVDGAGRVHPAAMFVESLIDKKLPPRHGAVSIQSFVTGHL